MKYLNEEAKKRITILLNLLALISSLGVVIFSFDSNIFHDNMWAWAIIALMVFYYLILFGWTCINQVIYFLYCVFSQKHYYFSDFFSGVILGFPVIQVIYYLSSWIMNKVSLSRSWFLLENTRPYFFSLFGVLFLIYLVSFILILKKHPASINTISNQNKEGN